MVARTDRAPRLPGLDTRVEDATAERPRSRPKERGRGNGREGTLRIELPLRTKSATRIGTGNEALIERRFCEINGYEQG